MKRFISHFSVLLVILALGFTGCNGQATQEAADPTSTVAHFPEPVSETPSQVIQEMAALMNAGDVEGSMAYFADDAIVYIIGLPPTGMEVYAGKEQIRSLWKDNVDNHFQWDMNIKSTDGDIVYVNAKTWHDFTRQLKVAPLEYFDIYEVKEGRITTYATTITSDALARFKPAFAEVMSMAEPVAPSTEQPVSELTVTIENGTCEINNPGPLQAGEIKVDWKVKDQNKNRYALTIFTLNADKDLLDLMASTIEPDPPSWSDMLLIVDQGPDMSGTYTFKVDKGPIYVICWSKPPDLPIGNAGPIDVKD
jgi:hypothetical protein